MKIRIANVILGLACFSVSQAHDDPELLEAIRLSEMDYEAQQSLRNSLEQQSEVSTNPSSAHDPHLEFALQQSAREEREKAERMEEEYRRILSETAQEQAEENQFNAQLEQAQLQSLSEMDRQEVENLQRTTETTALQASLYDINNQEQSDYEVALRLSLEFDEEAYVRQEQEYLTQQRLEAAYLEQQAAELERQRREEVARRRRAAEEAIEKEKALLDLAGKVMTKMIDAISDKHDSYKTLVRQIHEHEMNEQTCMDKQEINPKSRAYDEWLSESQTMEMRRKRLFNVLIKPEYDLISKETKIQKLMGEIEGLTKEKAEELLETMCL